RSPMPDAPERCPQCHSPVAERFPHAVMYDCGLSLFNDGELVTDDYPAECQRRRIKRLEKQLAAALAEAERWRKQYEALRAGVELILKQIETAPKPEEFIPTNQDEMMTELIYAMKGGKGHNKGFANGLWVAGMMLRGLLAEAGGG